MIWEDREPIHSPKSESLEVLGTVACGGNPPPEDPPAKPGLTTALPTDTKNLLFPSPHGIMQKNRISGYSAVGSAPALGVPWRYPGQVMAKRRKALQHLRLRGLSPVAEGGTKADLTTGMTTDRKNFDFPSRRDIMAEIEYPGVAKLVSRLIWVQETGRSSRPTRTKKPLKSIDFRGFFLFIVYCGAGFENSFRLIMMFTSHQFLQINISDAMILNGGHIYNHCEQY